MAEKMSASRIQNVTQEEESRARVDEDLTPDELSQEALNELRKHLEELPKNMRLFSLCFRALYTDQDVDCDSEAAVKFRKIRDDTRQDAMVYLKCILPVTTSFVRSVKEYFQNFEALSYEEWLRKLSDILKDTKEHKEFSQTVLRMHQNIMVLFKKGEDDAKLVMKDFENLQRAFEMMCTDYEATANKKKRWANALLFVPIVNLIACPLLGKSVRKNNARAQKKKKEAEQHANGALVVSNTLIPALSNFIDGLRNVAGFFERLQQELQSFEEKAEEDKRKKLHYKLMCHSAKDIKSLCYAFYEILPDVRTDFETLPRKDTDQKYVKEWLEKARVEIRSQSALKALAGARSEELDDRILEQPQPIPAPTPTRPRHVAQGIKLPGMETQQKHH